MTDNWQTELISNRPAPVAAKPSRRRRRTAGDRWYSETSSFGAYGSDPMASTYFGAGLNLDFSALEYLYKYNWLARRIIEALVNDATRKGFRIISTISQDEADRITRWLKKWKTLLNVKHHAYQARLYGGAAKINYIEDGMPTAYPVNYANVKGVRQTKIINRFHCLPWHFYVNPVELDRFETPWVYQVQQYAYGRMIERYEVHESRLAWMDGAYLPEHMRVANWGSGDSVLVAVIEELRNHGTSIQSAAATIQDYVTKVLKIDNLEDLLEENEADLQYRVEQADARANVHSTSVIGPNEELKKISTTITGLPELIVILMDVVSGAANTPKSKLFGHMTGSLGSSSGKYDKDNWNDQVETYQTDILTPSVEADIRLACAIERIDFETLMVEWLTVREKEKEAAEVGLLDEQARQTKTTTDIMIDNHENGKADPDNPPVKTPRTEANNSERNQVRSTIRNRPDYQSIE